MSSPIRRSSRLAAKQTSEDRESHSRSQSPARVASPARSRRSSVSTPTKPAGRRRKTEEPPATESPKRGRTRNASRTLSETSDTSVASSQTPVRRSRRISGLQADNVTDLDTAEGRRSRSRTPSLSLGDSKKVEGRLGTMSPIAEQGAEAEASPRRRIDFDGASDDEEAGRSPRKTPKADKSSKSALSLGSPEKPSAAKKGSPTKSGSSAKSTPTSSPKKSTPTKAATTPQKSSGTPQSSPTKKSTPRNTETRDEDQQQQQLSSDAQRVRRSSRISSASLHSRNEGSEAGEDLASLPHAEVVLDDASDSDIAAEERPPPKLSQPRSEAVITISDSDSDPSEELVPVTKSGGTKQTPTADASGGTPTSKGSSPVKPHAVTAPIEASTVGKGSQSTSEASRIGEDSGSSLVAEEPEQDSEQMKIARMDAVLLELFPPSPPAAQNAKSDDTTKEKKPRSPKKGVSTADEPTMTQAVEERMESETPAGGSDEAISACLEVEDASDLYQSRQRLNRTFEAQLPLVYAGLSSTAQSIRPIASVDEDLPEQLMKPDNNELVWQQLACRNKQFFKCFKKAKVDLTAKLDSKTKKASSAIAHEEYMEDEDALVEEADGEDVQESDENQETDIFNLRKEDLANLDQDLDALESDEDEEESDAHEAEPKKYRKSVVDDKFFSLAEMEEFLEAEDKKGAQSTTGIFDDVEDEDDSPADYRYAEFFVEQKKPRDERRQEGTNRSQAARFADESSDAPSEDEEVNDEEEVDDEVEDEEEAVDKRVLLGAVEDDEDKPQTSFEAQREKLRGKIEKFERENLEPRSWELSGEVRAEERETDTLLETYLDTDFRAKTAPVIVADTTEKLEAIIIQRIKDKAFDDVERKVRVDESLKPYRNEATDDVVRKSLTDVYEQEFQKAKGDIAQENDEIDPAIKEIEKDMGSLFEKLDALAHYQYRPSTIKPEAKIVQNMATMRVEEVGPMASAEPTEALMAPEEVLKHAKAAPKAADERDTTDKLRERRKKKKKQKVMAQKGLANGAKEQPALKKKIKKKKVRASGGNFFEKLQETTEQEIREKTKKKKRKALVGDDAKNSASRYML